MYTWLYMPYLVVKSNIQYNFNICVIANTRHCRYPSYIFIKGRCLTMIKWCIIFHSRLMFFFVLFKITKKLKYGMNTIVDSQYHFCQPTWKLLSSILRTLWDQNCHFIQNRENVLKGVLNPILFCVVHSERWFYEF